MKQDFQKDLKEGEDYQEFVTNILFIKLKLPILCYNHKEDQLKYGENPQGIEIKFDRMLEKTGNVYIETATLGHPLDGIYKENDESWLFIIGNYDKFYMFSRKTLIRMHVSGKFRQVENKYNSSSGFLLSGEDALEWCEKRIVINE